MVQKIEKNKGDTVSPGYYEVYFLNISPFAWFYRESVQGRITKGLNDYERESVTNTFNSLSVEKVEDQENTYRTYFEIDTIKDNETFDNMLDYVIEQANYFGIELMVESIYKIPGTEYPDPTGWFDQIFGGGENNPFKNLGAGAEALVTILFLVLLLVVFNTVSDVIT